MQASDIVAYTSIIVALTLAPGPLIAIVVSRSLHRDISGAFAFSVGIATGDVFTIFMVSAGLGIWMQSAPEFFLFAKFGALAYLLYIAYSMWVSPCGDGVCLEKRKSGMACSIIVGMLTCMVTPQTILFYLLLLPRFLDITNVSLTMVGYIAIITFAAIILSLTGVIIMAHWLTKLPGASEHRFLNRALSFIIVLSAFWMIQ